MTLMDFLEKTIERYLAFRSRPQIVNKYLAGKKIKKSDNCRHIQLSRIRVATTQVPLTLLDDPLEWVDLLYRQVEKGVRSGAQLIVFPENVTLHLLGLIPGVQKLGASAAQGSPQESNTGVDMVRVFRLLGNGVEKMYRHTVSQLAARFQVYIMGGSRPVPDRKGQVLNVASLFGPRGQLIGSQAKTHLLPLEADWGICPGSKLQVFPTPLGRIAFPVCMDATYFETFRILAHLGADLVIIPIANPEEYNQWKALRGIWPRVQESYVYGVKSALVGKNFFGLNFTGKAGIFAPIELHPECGVLALADNPLTEDLVIADLDVEKLRKTRQHRLYGGDRNLALYRHYFPSVYSS